MNRATAKGTYEMSRDAESDSEAVHIGEEDQIPGCPCSTIFIVCRRSKVRKRSSFGGCRFDRDD